MFNQGKNILHMETTLKNRAKLKNHAPFEEKNILQFNHGEKNRAHSHAEKELHAQKSCHPLSQKSNGPSLI